MCIRSERDLEALGENVRDSNPRGLLDRDITLLSSRDHWTVKPRSSVELADIRIDSSSEDPSLAIQIRYGIHPRRDLEWRRNIY